MSYGLTWSPASIAGRLPIDYPGDQACRVSHEAIYQWIYAQPVATLARELLKLRTGRTARKGGRRPPPAPRITDPTYIDDRPTEVEGRQVPGHWEGDLVIGKLTPKGYEELDRAHVIDPTRSAAGRKVVWCMPAFANKRMYVRNDKEMVCVDLAK